MKRWVFGACVCSLLAASLGATEAVHYFHYYQWGLPGDQPLSGDFDCDGKPDLVVYRASEGVWYIRRSGNDYSIPQSSSYQWGIGQDIPVIMDYDGDGRADFVVWRPADGTWYISTNRLFYQYPCKPDPETITPLGPPPVISPVIPPSITPLH